MEKLITFDSKITFGAYLDSKIYKVLGTGSEGTCFLGKDGFAYKDLTNGFGNDLYVPQNIITTHECKNKSFAFPHCLFVVGEELVGYTSDAIIRDITNNQYLFNCGIDHIDFNKLYRAYEIMREDALTLAAEGTRIYDLSFNLLFDGETLTGVDTCGYYKDSVLNCRHNSECVDQAVKDLFSLYVRFTFGDEVDFNMDVASFLDMIEQKYSNHGTPKGKNYTKQKITSAQ